MKKTGYIFLTGLLLSIGCAKSEETPKVTYEEPQKEVKIPEVKIDSSQIKISDLPVYMEGTKYLIHAIGDVRLYGKSTSRYGSSKTNSVSYSLSNYNRFELTGYLNNLKFQHIDSVTTKTLTDKMVEIHTVTYLDEISKKISRGILVYTLVDSDTNRDRKIDANDIKTLYISEINGDNFTKLSADLEELIDWNTIEVQNRLYFRTIEDINKNGNFDKNDLVHYYYVDLKSPEWEVIKYNPFE
ncbi:MAG: hypothetical protein WCY89_04125 [Flavobacteriaceae bacterium]